MNGYGSNKMTENLSKFVFTASAQRLIIKLQENKQLTIFNNSVINALQGKKTLKKENSIMHQEIYAYGREQEYLLYIDKDNEKEYEGQIKKFGPQTFRFLCYIILLLTKQNSKAQMNLFYNEIRFKVRDYQKLRELRSYKSTRAQIINEANLLSRSWLEFKTTVIDNGKRKKLSFKIRLIDAVGEIKNGDVIVSLSLKFVSFLIKYGYPMSLPERCFSLKMDIAFEISWKLYSYTRINQNKRKSDKKPYFIINTKVLLDAIGSIPQYENVVKSKNRQVGDRIVRPLINGLNELIKQHVLFYWEFCNAKGETLSGEQLEVSFFCDPLKKNLIKGSNKYYLKWSNFKCLYIKYELNKIY
jgi:hypothetical protein